MAFPIGPFGGQAPENNAQQPDPNSEVAQLKKQLEEVNNKFENQRNLLLQQSNQHNQELGLLRRQLSESVSRTNGQTLPEPQQQVQTDDWMSFLGGGTTSSQPAPTQQTQKPLTEAEVRRIWAEEEQKKQMAMHQEHQRIETLNARFEVEHPELAKNPQAAAIIRNQFLAATNLRPDLPAEQRYQLAIANAKDLLPQIPVPQQEKKAKNPPNNPYMPNIFGAPPSRVSNQNLANMVDYTPQEERFAQRQEQMKQWSQRHGNTVFGI